MKAEEYCTNPEAPGVWEQWRWSRPTMLASIAVADSGVDVQRINPALFGELWTKFQRLREMWQSHRDLDIDAFSPRCGRHHRQRCGRTKNWCSSTWVPKIRAQWQAFRWHSPRAVLVTVSLIDNDAVPSPGISHWAASAGVAL